MRRGADLLIVQCSGCGFVYLDCWRESLAAVEDLYDYYREIDDEALERRYSAVNRARQSALLARIAAAVGAGGEPLRLLDVGCGEGQLLRTARNEGWRARGIDLSRSAIDLCRRKKLDADVRDFFDVSLDTEKYDAIVMSELVEHVPAPQRFLQRAEQLLRGGGLLYLTTPNFASLARRLLGSDWSVIHPEHIGYFDPRTLRAMVSQHTGLKPLKIETNNVTPSMYLAFLSKGLVLGREMLNVMPLGKRASRRGRRTEHKSSAAQQTHRRARTGIDQVLRRSVHNSPLLGRAKDATNGLVSRIGVGDTLVAYLRKAPST